MPSISVKGVTIIFRAAEVENEFEFGANDLWGDPRFTEGTESGLEKDRKGMRNLNETEVEKESMLGSALHS